ncbi:hypothetical protein COCOBI_10-1010 [Coccomyxa sp. Obi]|nr:hypothetical protein COCOBI_10-1010 [Coccomyxa sp. Obi]
MWNAAVLLFLLGSAGGVSLPPVGTPIHAPSFAPSIAQAKAVAAAAPAVDAPLDKGNPMASSIQPYALPPNHAAHVNSADDWFDDLGGAVVGAVGGAVAIAGGAIAHAAQGAGDILAHPEEVQHGIEGFPDVAAEAGQEIEMSGHIEGLGEAAGNVAVQADRILADGAEGLAASQPGGAGAAASASEAEAGAAGAQGLGAEIGGAVGGGEIGLAVEGATTATLEAGAVGLQTAQARLHPLDHVPCSAAFSRHPIAETRLQCGADSVPLDLQDGDVTTTDASIKAAQNKGISKTVQRAMQAGKKQNPSAQAPLTAFQNIALLAPQQAVMAKAPSALPSAIQAGLSTPVNPSSVASGGRKMLQSAPDCCNSYTVKPGDTLTSIAQAYGQPTNGAQIMQARRAVNGLPGDVAPGQTIMLPCGRLLTYINAYNVGAISKAAAINAVNG